MRAEQFIKDHGVEKAKEVVEGAPKYATHFELGVDGVFYFKYFGFSWFCFGSQGLINTYMDDYETCHLIDLLILKRLVESVDLVNFYGGFNKARMLSCDEFYDEVNYYDLQKAIADYESIYGEEGASHE